MRGTLTIRPRSIDVSSGSLGDIWRLSIDGQEIGQVVPMEGDGITLVRPLGLCSQDYFVRLNAHGEYLASIRYEPNLRTDDELRGAILRETKLHTAIGEELEAIAAKFGISREHE